MSPAEEAGRAARAVRGRRARGELVSHSPIDGSAIGRVRGRRSRTPRARGRHEAFLEWRTVPAPRRGELVRLLGEELRAAKEPLARLVTLEAGKIVQEGLGEVQEMIDICDFAVGLSRQLYGLTIASERPDHRMMEQWHPLGPVLVISAFNFPVAVWAWNAALALVCGDPVIWKPSEKTPLTRRGGDGAGASARSSGSAMRPTGWSSCVQGGRDVGEALVDDPRIALVSATGSTAMGRAVGPRVAQRFGRVAARAWRQQCDDRHARRADLDAGRAGDPVLGGRDGGPALHDAAAADRPRKHRRRAGRAAAAAVRAA